jgi:ribosomal protein S18 acetylase RimI-like enzyme
MSEFDLHDNFVIREYRDGDQDGIIHLWELTGMGSPERGDNKEVIETTIKLGGTLLVMEEKSTGRISGTSWLTYDGRRILLHHFCILPDLQGNGLSKILLRNSLQFAKQKGCQIKLEVHSNNIKAINLYKKFGFRHLEGYNVYIIRDISHL